MRIICNQQVLLLVFCVTLAGCGGGGSQSSMQPSGTPPPPPALTITTRSNLPGTLTNSAYSVTLQAINGVGTLTWSIAPIDPTAWFGTGLAIDPSTDVVSGRATF